MKNIFLVIVVIALSFFACKKKPQAWTDIQGNWDIEQCLINGADSTASIKGYCYDKTNIAYFGTNQKGGDKLIHIYTFTDHYDYGSLYLEDNNYEKMKVCNFNLGRIELCPKKALSGQCVDWDVISISSSAFEIKSIVNNVNYYVKYKKI